MTNTPLTGAALIEKRIAEAKERLKTLQLDESSYARGVTPADLQLYIEGLENDLEMLNRSRTFVFKTSRGLG